MSDNGGALPRGWTEEPLKDLIEPLQSGSRPRGGARGVLTGIPSIGGEHLTADGGFFFANVKFVPDAHYASMRRGHIRLGDVLVVKDGATTGKVALVRDDFPYDTAVVNEHVFICRPRENVISEYLFWFLHSSEGQRRILEHFQGSAQGGINQTFADGTQVPVAPLKEQRAIVSVIEAAVDRGKSATRQVSAARAALSRTRRAALVSAFSGALTEGWRAEHPNAATADSLITEVEERRRDAWARRTNRKYVSPVDADSDDLPDLPASWLWMSADAVCSQITDGEHIQPPYVDEGLPMLSAKHVRDGFVDPTGAGLITSEAFMKARERCAPSRDDLLIVSVGATTGRAAIVEQDEPFAIVRSVLLLKPVIDPRFFLRWLQNPWAFRWMTEASGASAQPHLYIRDVRKLPVPLPPPEEQQELLARVDGIFMACDQVEQRLAMASREISRATRYLLNKAFRGELRTNAVELEVVGA